MRSLVYLVGCLVVMMRSIRAFAPSMTISIDRPKRSISLPSQGKTEVARLNSIDFNPDESLTFAPIVIMHGLLGNSRNFNSWAAKLVEMLDKPRRVYAVDMRNHGQSEHRQRMTYPDMAADVINFIEEKGLQQAVLIGHSMGGKTACAAALMRPDLISGLVCMDIAPVSYAVVDQSSWGETQKIISAVSRMDLSRIASKRDADKILESQDILDPQLRAFALTNLVQKEDKSWDWRVNIKSIARSMSDIAQFDGLKGFPPYVGEAFFMAGAKSSYIRSSHLPTISSFFPRYALRSIPNAGHWCHADNPQGTLDAAKMYLDRPELP